MSFSLSDLAHFLLAVVLFLACAHGMGAVFRRLRQPPVIGEILAGLLLGPTVLGAYFPQWYHAVFLINDSTRHGLGAIYQLGLLLLMFASGLELRSTFQRGEQRTSLSIAVFGTIIPFVFGLLLHHGMDLSAHIGPAGNVTAFYIVFAIAIAVTSIPVIARILLDLKIIDSSFGRIVLSAAVIEDVLLYVVLAVALSLVGASHGDQFGLPGLLDLATDSQTMVYYIAVNLLFFCAALRIGPPVFRLVANHPLNLLRKDSPTAFSLFIMLTITGFAIFLGIPAMFGAFVAGMVVGQVQGTAEESRQMIKPFADAFFIPIYFAIVGFKLNLLHSFDLKFFLFFFIAACLVKVVSVYLGARIAREGHQTSVNLGMAMNARGGPGIVLASVALDAGVISQGFYASLVLLVILTSFMAGAWLGHVVRKGQISICR